MGRLIDADVLYSKTESLLKGFPAEKEIFLTLIDDAPTVDAAPVVHGRWENREGYDNWNCSECDFEISRYDDNPANYTDARYCSCCGAKMDG